jgi:hypothetical protein
MLRSVVGYFRRNVVGFLALFVALGGTAYAVNTVGSTDIIDGQVKSVDVGDAEIKSADVKDESLTTFDVSTFLGVDVVDGSLTGDDLQDSSVRSADISPLTIRGEDIGFNAVDDVHVVDNSMTEADIDEPRLFQCHGGTALFGRICASAGGQGTFGTALGTCGAAGLRVPTWGEAYLLARNHAVPGVTGAERFWTDEITSDSGTGFVYVVLNENLSAISTGDTNTHKIVCVETPTGLP